jgi:phosphopantothenoylcysteine decarboxylase/phosphopantothenate--cysteine ligase
MLRDKRILLIIGGGIAAYKTLDLIRRLKERGAGVRAILTRAGAEFVTPLTLASLSGDKVFTDLFSLTDEAEIGHIELSRDADLVVVAPATADLMAKMAAGLADDLATTALLATDKPVLIAPAMNVRMWLHAATQRSLRRLIADGVRVVGPNEGDMACGEYGPGRMAEPHEILGAIEAQLRGPDRPLTGRRALVTAGPTHEPIDPVRYIANRSSGRQGYAIASALAELGADTVLVSGPVALEAPPGVARTMVETGQEMLRACERLLPADVAVCAAAVADWRAEAQASQKLKKPGGKINLSLIENPDVLATLAHHARRPRLVIGFAAETEDLIAHAQEKRARKGCDWILANDVSAASAVFGGDENEVHLVTASGVEDWPRASKSGIAARLARRIAEQLGPAHA